MSERQHVVGSIDGHHSVYAYRGGIHVFVIAQAVGASFAFVRFERGPQLGARRRG